MDKPKRWRPWRFSVRTLTILVTLVCCYFGAWEATRKHAEAQNSATFNEEFYNVRSPAPFVVTYESGESLVFTPNGVFSKSDKTGHYVWFFGPAIQLTET